MYPTQLELEAPLDGELLCIHYVPFSECCEGCQAIFVHVNEEEAERAYERRMSEPTNA